MLQSVINGQSEMPMALRVLSAGILANTIQDAASPFLPPIMDTVSSCIAQDWSVVLQKAADLSAKIELESAQSGAQQQAEDTSNNASSGIDLDAIKKSIDGKHAALQALESQTRYLQLSLEILSNLFCEEGASGEQEEWEDADKDLDMDVDPSDGMTLDEEDASAQMDSPCLSLLGPGLFASLTSLLSLSTPSEPALESLTAEWATVKERTLGSLTNILSSGSPSFWATNSSWAHSLWTTLFSTGSPQVLASHIETLWAMSRILPTNSVHPTMEQGQSLIHIFQHASTLPSEDVSASDIQTASVGVLGYMGRTQGCVSLNEVHILAFPNIIDIHFHTDTRIN
jgi:hypothetical protein